MLRYAALAAAAAAPLLYPTAPAPAPTDAVALAPAAVPSAAVAPAALQDGGEEVAVEEEDPLDESMMQLKGGTRALRGLMARGDVEGCLRVVSNMQAATIVAKGETPHTAEEQPEDGREAFIADYRRTMLTLLEHLISLERAMLDGDMEAAETIFKESVRPMEKQGHQRFKNSSDW